MKTTFGSGPVFAPGARWLGLACAVALALGLVRLGQPGLWIEEIYTARWAALPWASLFATLREHLHPPLFFVLERLAAPLLGRGDAGLRVLSVLSGVAAVAATFWAFRPLINDRPSAATAWVLALSPQFFLYARMAHYYALGVLIAMVAHGLFVRLAVRRGRPQSWVLYALAATLLLYTSYLAVCLVLAHGVWAAFARRRRGLLRGWLLAAAAAAALFAPWLLLLQRPTAAHALARAAKPAEWALLLGLDFHALTATELSFPWEPAGVIGLVCGGWLLAVGALAAVRRGLGRSVLLPALAALALSWILVSSLSSATPFAGLPSRTLFLWPFAAVLMALGALDSAQDRRLRWLATGGLVLVWIVGWVHLYRQEHFMNPIYLTPGREVAAELARDAAPGDGVIADDDSGVNYYFERLGAPVPIRDPVDPAAVQRLLDDPALRRVWWVRLSRDGTQRARPAQQTLDMLSAWGELETTRGYLEIDPRYRVVKRVVLHLPAYQYRVVVERWRRKG